MKTRESIERGGDIFTCVRDDTRGLEYTFTCEVEPVQAEGVIQGFPLYFRAKRDSYRFAISEDENVSPVRMTDGSSGFYVSVDLPNAGGMPLEEAEEIIERLTDQYLENRSK
jgi:hypothetical protein